MNTALNELLALLRKGERRALAKAITLIESTRENDKVLSKRLLSQMHRQKTTGHIVAVTGPPGVGKSTFLEAIGLSLVKQGLKVAVLAIDPSSRMHKGAILGDKTRMTQLSQQENAFIRPTASGGHLGGVAATTHETALLCLEAGYDVVFIETLGVGQAETLVADICDVFVLLISPGDGDDLQAIKRGVMELADIVLINKAEPNRQNEAKTTLMDYKMSASLSSSQTSKKRQFAMMSALYGSDKMGEIWALIEPYLAADSQKQDRHKERVDSMWITYQQLWLDYVKKQSGIDPNIKNVIAKLQAQQISSASAAEELVQIFKK